MTEYLHRDPTLRDELFTIEEVGDCSACPSPRCATRGCSAPGRAASSSGGGWRQDVMDWLDEQRESGGRGVV